MKSIEIIVLLSISAITLFAATPGTNFSIVQVEDLGNVNNASVQDIWIGSDLDGDNQGEIIIQTGQSSDARVVIFEYNGSSYSQVWSVNLPFSNKGNDCPQRLLSVADSDNDGFQEIYVANSAGSGTYAVCCYEMNSGALSLSNPSTVSKGPDNSGGILCFLCSSPITGIVTGDADSDNKYELYVGHANNSSSLEIWESDGNDSWTKLGTKSVGDGIVDLYPPSNLRGNGKTDIGVCEEHGKLTVLNCSDPTNPTYLTVQSNVDKGANIKGKLTVFNLDGANYPEIVIGNDDDSSLYVFEWDASNNYFTRDKTDAPLLSLGFFPLSIDAYDTDADGKGEIFYTIGKEVRYREFNSTTGDFSSQSDFSTEQTLVSDCDENVNVIRVSRNSANTLLDGDSFRDLAVGTHGSGVSGHNELVIMESSVEDNSLPVGISRFDVYAKNDYVHLEWHTESEIENQGFVIFRSVNEKDYVEVASYRESPELTGRNQSKGCDYQWSDLDVLAGNFYSYILADVDYHGNITKHYELIRGILFFPEESEKLKIYPNPCNPEVNIRIPEKMTPCEVNICSLEGKIVRSFKIPDRVLNDQLIVWDGQDGRKIMVSSGIYLLLVKSKHGTFKKKFTFIK